jgi:hypothetical protein
MTVNVGDILNPSGNQLVMDGSSLFLMNWAAQGSGSGALSESSLWKPGLTSATWAQNADGTGALYFSKDNPGSEDELYPTLPAIQHFGPSVLIASSAGPKGPLTITPRLLTAAEKAAYCTRQELQSNWLSFAADTSPDSIKPVCYLEIEAQMPIGPNGALQGLWPAWWMLVNGEWPPEIDCFEMFGAGYPGSHGMTTSVHTTDPNWTSKLPAGLTYVGQGTATQAPPVSFGPTAGMHRYGSLITGDQILTFFDRKCVMAWPMPSDLVGAAVYPIINLAIGTAGSGVGAPPAGATSVGSYVIGDVQIWSYPNGYGASNPVPTPTPTPVPTPTPSPVPTPTPTPVPTPVPTPTPPAGPSPSGTIATPGRGTITDAAGSVWYVTAAKVVVRNGASVSGSNIVELAYVNGGIYESDGNLWWSWSDGANSWSSNPVSSPIATPPVPTPTPTPVPTPTPTPTPPGPNAAAITKAKADIASAQTLLTAALAALNS